MELQHFLTPYTKRNSKWIKDLNVRPETIKLVEENIGKTLIDVNQKVRSSMTNPQHIVMEIKTKVNKWDLIKLKRFEQQRKCKQGEKRTLRVGENNSK